MSKNVKLVNEYKVEINNLLQSTLATLKLHNENSNKNGEHFNILGVSRNEVGTHSKFLYELFSADGSHGMGNTFLNHFVISVLEINDKSQVFKVTRENNTKDNKRIDFVFESSKHLIGIEMKIDAGDQLSQLYDYHSELQRKSLGKEVRLLYLTLDGKIASPDSLKASNTSGDCLSESDYERFSFENHIINWISLCIKESATKSVLREALIQYHLLLEKITNQHMDFKMNLGKKLASTKNDLIAALEIEKAIVVAKKILLTQFWTALNANLVKNEREIMVHGGDSIQLISNNYYDYSRNNKNIGLNYYIGDFRGKRISMFINLYHWVSYGLRVTDVKENIIEDKEIKEHLKKYFSGNKAYYDSCSDWIIAFYDDGSNEQKTIKFDGEHEQTSLALTNESGRNKLIDPLVKHINLIETQFLEIKNNDEKIQVMENNKALF